jgi:hypothetical protein
MASEVLVKSGTPIVATMTSLASLPISTTTGGAQSAKMDLGATRAQQMLVRLQAAFQTSPTAGTALEVYVAFSSQSTATSGNVANLSGADAAYTGYNSDLSVAKRQLTFVGVLSAANTTATQSADVGSFTPMDRYCQVIAVNSATQPLVSTATWHACTIYPLIDEAQ